MLTLTQLADSLDGVWHGNANHAIFGLSSLVRATSNDLAYFENPLLIDSLQATSAGAVLLKAEHQPLCPVNSIVVAHPLAAMNAAVKLLSPMAPLCTGVHQTALVHQTAQLGKNVSIGPFSVIGECVRVDDGVTIGANCRIETSVAVGANSKINSGVTIHSGSRLGANVFINSGSVIGASPFNYIKQHGTWEQGPDVGGVFISNGVHIGANSVIDRGSLGDTFIAERVCVDNLVQIAHDVCIERDSAIAGCAAIGAHAHIGADCIIGGAACIAAFVRLADDVVITGMTTVNKSISKSGIYSSGTLVHGHEQWRKNAARFKRLDDYIAKLNSLERKINDAQIAPYDI
ncbi:UDP-3-O-(3-hydroxymyristoyl)glucosamine N-acyltransferase [uncultured Legionella sp.]|uniref:UDP-3-O-(3-hydroxymyristoyl)glucosamine N-acyltransferase n=1 Tax=uncultured Legionella sp. TaxID=210934 RepID=UPI00262DEDF5|nr:UDP-3-O-(3-hydroxymyristoyl)glucosamine N-acyltransferase [uncultured Legionella sp.]